MNISWFPFHATICLTLFGVIRFAVGLEDFRLSVYNPINHNEVPLHYSGPRLIRQYAGGPFQYQSPDYAYYSSVIPFGRASSSKEYNKNYCFKNNVRRNKLMAVKFWQDIIAKKDPIDLEKYLLPTFIQHSPHIADGIESLREALNLENVVGLQEKITFLHVSAVGNLVWLHTRRDLTNGDVVVHLDLVRFECGKMAEHWDVVQKVDLSKPIVTDHPFF